MDLNDMSAEERLRLFREIFRFPAFQSAPSMRWRQRIFGKCGDIYVTDLVDLVEDPAHTALSPAENIRKHWFNDATHNYTTYLTDAFARGIIGETLYHELMTSDVYFGCSDDDAPKTSYTIVCPRCGETFRLLLPDPYTAVGGVVPSCPFCGGFLLSVQPRYPSEKSAEHGEVYLVHMEAGASYFCPMYCLYPDAAGESAEAREDRLVAMTVKACENVDLPAEEREALIRELYRRNPYILHAAPRLLQAIADAEGGERERKRAAFLAITVRDEANTALAALGYQTRRSAGVIHHPGVAVPMSGLDSSMGFPGTMIPGSVNGGMTTPPKSHRFCPACGTPAQGKFCTECGARVNP